MGGQRPPQPGLGHHHRPWWLPRSDRAGSHDHGGRDLPRLFCFPSCVFFFLHSFSILPVNLPSKRMYLATKREKNSILPPFHYHLLLVFIRLERKRDAKIARIPCWVCNRKTQVRFLAEHSFPSLLFP